MRPALARVGFRIDSGGSNHLARQTRIVFAQLGLGCSLGNKVGNMMHENPRALEGRGASLDVRIHDDQPHRCAVFCEIGTICPLQKAQPCGAKFVAKIRISPRN